MLISNQPLPFDNMLIIYLVIQIIILIGWINKYEY